MRQVHQEFLEALTQIAKCQERLDCSSNLHNMLRAKIDKLSPQLTKAESEDAYWFSLALDRPGEGALLTGETDDEDEDRAE